MKRKKREKINNKGGEKIRMKKDTEKKFFLDNA